MISELTLTAEKIDELKEDVLLSLIDLRTVTPDASHTTRWEDSVGQVWEFPCHLVVIGTRSILWSDADEAGIDDITLSDDAYDDQSDRDEQLREFAEDIASGLGKLIGTGEICPDCGKEISWGNIQTRQYEANWREGECGCVGRQWVQREQGPGNDWALSCSDGKA